MEQRDKQTSRSEQGFSLIKELCRKGVHLSVLLIPFGYHLLLLPLWFIQLILFGVLCLFIPMEIYRLKINPETFINFITRPSEKNEPANYVLTTGVWLIILLGANVFYPMMVAELALVSTVIGDSVAAVVGRGIGRKPLPFTKNKTVEGFVAGVFTTYTIGIGFLIFIDEFSLVLPLIPAIIWSLFDFFEDLPWYSVDNVFVPTLSIILIVVLDTLSFIF